MTEASTGLFHTRIAPLLNLHRLLPEQIVESVLASESPLACREGFLRQVAGWREFVRHVHRETNGFENLVKSSGESLPQTFWGDAPSGLRCLDHTVDTVWREGYSHHITRLMVLGNLATLLEVDALELRDWFWVAYTDAYDWVVDPNVLGMATWATRGVMTTKPYISGAAYLNRMGDHCSSCDFHPKKNCPVTHLYWAWMERHGSELKGNVRMAMPLKSLSKRSPEKRNEDREVFSRVQEALANRERLTP
jgi:deoxyribodipyrimidine photolyase-related protein